MSNAEARAWWADVQHLREESAPALGIAVQESTDDDHPTEELPRTGRITGRPMRRGEHPSSRAVERRLAREDAADFAAALDLDGAFGTPRARRGDRAVSREIVLTRDEPLALEPEAEVTPPLAPAPPAEPAERAELHAESARRAAEHEALLVPREQFERGADGRRTVQITGQAAGAARSRLRELERRRPQRRAVDRAASRPDRIALWAVVLGIVLVVIAVASSSAQAATLPF